MNKDHQEDAEEPEPVREPEPAGEPEPAREPEPTGESEPAGEPEPAGEQEPTNEEVVNDGIANQLEFGFDDDIFGSPWQRSPFHQADEPVTSDEDPLSVHVKNL